MAQGLKDEYNDVHARLNAHLDREAHFDAEIAKLKQDVEGNHELVQTQEKKIEELQSTLDEKNHTQQILSLQSLENERKIKDKEAVEKRLREELLQNKKNSDHTI